jgi:hypothetical protein
MFHVEHSSVYAGFRIKYAVGPMVFVVALLDGVVQRMAYFLRPMAVMVKRGVFGGV